MTNNYEFRYFPGRALWALYQGAERVGPFRTTLLRAGADLTAIRRLR